MMNNLYKHLNSTIEELNLNRYLLSAKTIKEIKRTLIVKINAKEIISEREVDLQIMRELLNVQGEK